MTRSVLLVTLFGVQASLLFCALDLLPLWSDEVFTLKTVAHPLPEIIPLVQHDIHPPLYFVLLRGWMNLPLPWAGIAGLRAFSGLWALAAGLLFYALWTRGTLLPVALFTLSPCLLLYGRMARSYSMQVALVLLAVVLLQRWMAAPRSLWLALGAFASLLALLYTHYLPGIAVLAGFVAVAWPNLGWRRLAVFSVLVVVGYWPWIRTLSTALRTWGEAANFSSTYSLTGNPVLEQLVKLGFALVSLTIGESFPVPVLLIAPAMVWLAVRGAGEIQPLVGIALLLGYVGVARWVSYPFVPGRLLWLLPFLCLAAASGLSRIHRLRIKRLLPAAILCSYACSILVYFGNENFVNQSFVNLGYVAPLPRIAVMIRSRAHTGALVLLDSYNTDFQALEFYLSGRPPDIPLDQTTVAEALQRARAIDEVWIVRNTRDISPGGLTTSTESQVCAGRKQQVILLEPYAGWQRMALRVAGFQPVPTHFYQVKTCSRY